MDSSMTMEDLARTVEALPQPTDVPVSLDWDWDIDDDFRIRFGGRIAPALAMYQGKSMFDAKVDLTGTRCLQLEARWAKVQNVDAATLAKAERAAVALRHQVASLNAAMAATDDIDATARTYIDESGNEVVGGLVSRRYAPISHLRLVELMMDNVQFDSAVVQKARVSPSRLDAVIMLDGSSWKVDGGIKSGMRFRNGQFGDYSYGWEGMLFWLLCTNGMMDVVASEEMLHRHVKREGIDLGADLAAAMQRGDEMFDRSRLATEVKIDVPHLMVELFRRGFLTRGSLRETAKQLESMGGVAGHQRDSTLWGASQVVTAAARKYSFGQYDSMGRLAGRLVFKGVDPVLASKPLPNDAPNSDEIYEEFFAAAA
jgi:hypothetical protein